MAKQSLPTKSPTRPTRRPASVPTTGANTADPIDGGSSRMAATSAPAPHPNATPTRAIRHSTLVFRSLLLVAAAIAVAFTAAALIAPSGLVPVDTSPDAPPPAVLEQPSD